MELIMTKLTVKKEHLESEIHYSRYGSSCKVVLKSATQEELAGLKETGDFDHLFENAKDK
jgi:hypothetical protein